MYLEDVPGPEEATRPWYRTQFFGPSPQRKSLQKLCGQSAPESEPSSLPKVKSPLDQSRNLGGLGSTRPAPPVWRFQAKPRPDSLPRCSRSDREPESALPAQRPPCLTRSP